MGMTGRMSSLCPGCLNRKGCTRQCRLCAEYRLRLMQEAQAQEGEAGVQQDEAQEALPAGAV